MVLGDAKMMEIARISGIGEWTERRRKTERGEEILYEVPTGKVFLVDRGKTIEVRCDGKLGRKLREEYETVMESRYFGWGGIEIVMCGQLEEAEIEDLVRLSYNMTLERENGV